MNSGGPWLVSSQSSGAGVQALALGGGTEPADAAARDPQDPPICHHVPVADEPGLVWCALATAFATLCHRACLSMVFREASIVRACHACGLLRTPRQRAATHWAETCGTIPWSQSCPRRLRHGPQRQHGAAGGQRSAPARAHSRRRCCVGSHQTAADESGEHSTCLPAFAHDESTWAVQPDMS